jgi:hypothetical protein
VVLILLTIYIILINYYADELQRPTATTAISTAITNSRRRLGPTLIVTPPTIQGQWESGFKRHSNLKVGLRGTAI